jgi:hypothetical protein
MFISCLGECYFSFFKTLKNIFNFKWTRKYQWAFKELKSYLSSLTILSQAREDEELFLHLGVSNLTISVVLIWDEKRIQKRVYYTSKVLLDVKIIYLKIEKVALALISSVRKLNPYFQSYNMIILTNQPLRQILHKLYLWRCLVKWAIELGKFWFNKNDLITWLVRRIFFHRDVDQSWGLYI